MGSGLDSRPQFPNTLQLGTKDIKEKGLAEAVLPEKVHSRIPADLIYSDQINQLSFSIRVSLNITLGGTER